MDIKTASGNSSLNPIPVMGIEAKKVSDSDERLSQIAVLAYYKAEARGYKPGYEVQDWLEAEAEIAQ